ncbi:MAG: GAF domain-containing protein, partial [Acidimicrobiales bacterium]
MVSILDQVAPALLEVAGGHTELLALVARTTGSALGGSCVIWLFDDTGRFLDGTAAYDPDPARHHLVELAVSGSRHFAAGEHFAGALVTAVPTTTRGFRWQDIAGWADPDAAAQLALSGETTLTLVVLRAREHTVGILGLLRAPLLGELTELDLSLLRHLGERLAVALDDRYRSLQSDRRLEELELQERAVRAREASLSTVSRSGPVLLLGCDAEGLVTTLEGGLSHRLATGLGSAVGRRLADLFAGDPVAVEVTRRCLQGDPVSAQPIELDGLQLELWATPLRGDDGGVEGFAGVGVDVSAHVAAEATILATARRQAALVDHASDVILVLAPEGTVRYVNPAAEHLLGYPWKVGDALDVVSLAHPEDRQAAQSTIGEGLARPGSKSSAELRMRHASGDYRVISVRCDNMTDDAAVGGFVVSLRDVTDERATEDRMLATADRQAALADLGRWALAGLQYSGLVEDAVSLLASQVGVDIVHVFEVLPDTEFLTLSASFGHDTSPGEILSADPTSSPASFALVTQETVVSDDLALEERFDVPDLWTRAGAVNVVEVPIPGQDAPVGVLGAGRRSHEPFADEDLNYVKAVAYVLAAAVDRHRSELAIREQVLQDPLTGLPNRLVLAEHNVRSANLASSRLPMSGAERSLFVFDIDRFKDINDT